MNHVVDIAAALGIAVYSAAGALPDRRRWPVRIGVHTYLVCLVAYDPIGAAWLLPILLVFCATWLFRPRAMLDLRSKEVRWRVVKIDRAREDRGLVVVLLRSVKQGTTMQVHLLVVDANSRERLRRLEHARATGTLLPTEDL